MIPVSEISRRLADIAEQVCTYLLSGWKRVKDELCCGSIHGGEGDSLKVHLSGPFTGHWTDWANPTDKGDLLDLWRLSRALSAGEAVQQAKTYLGITDPISTTSRKAYQPAPSKPDSAPNPQGRAFRWLTETRRLTAGTLELFKVATETEGSAPSIVFPCYSPKGELVNRSYRTIPKSGQKKVWQDTGCAPCLFGWQPCRRPHTAPGPCC